MRNPDPERQNAIFRRVARTVFDRVTRGDVSRPVLLSALARGVREGRIQVHSFDPEEQQVLSGTTIAAELDVADDRSPQLGVYLNDATGSKMSYYLRSDVTMTSRRCSADGVQVFRGEARLTSQAPEDAAQLDEYITGGGVHGTPPGQQLVLVRLYGAQGGVVGDLTIDGTPVPTSSVDDRGRAVLTVPVLLEPGESTRLVWHASTGPSQPADARLRVTPGLNPEPGEVRVASSCA